MENEEVKGLIAQNKELLTLVNRVLAENAEIKTLMGEGAGSSRMLKRVTQRIVEVRMIDGKVALGYVNHGTENSKSFFYEKPDPKDARNMITMADVVLEGSKEALSIDWKQFRKESKRVKCKILKTDEKEWIENQGTVKKREIEEYSSIELDFEVPLDVIHKSYFYTVEVPKEFGGPREVVIGESMVNIA